MPSFSATSKSRLETCHKDLQALLSRAIVHFDFSVIEGHRTLQRQQELYAEGRSRLDGKLRRSKHQESPSNAVDIMPYPADLHGVNIWDDMTRWALCMGRIQGIADEMGINIRLGIDWDGDMSAANHKFVDAPHIELADGLH